MQLVYQVIFGAVVAMVQRYGDNRPLAPTVTTYDTWVAK